MTLYSNVAWVVLLVHAESVRWRYTCWVVLLVHTESVR